MNASSYAEFMQDLPEYDSMPVNLVAGFANGDISYNLLASNYELGSGNQVLDGTIGPYSNHRSLISTDDLPSIANPQSGYLIAANNQPLINSRAVPGTVRSHQLNMRLASML